MAKLLIALVVVFFSVAANTQTLVLSNNHFNIVYEKVENPMSFAVDDVSCEEITLKSKNGTITNQNGCHFVFVSDTVGVAAIEVFKIKGTRSVKLGEVALSVRSLEVNAFVGNLSGGSVNKNLLMTMGGVRAQFEGFTIGLPVIAYKVMIQQKEAAALFSVMGPKYSPELVTAFSKMDTGDIVLIYDIKAQYPDGRAATIKPLEFLIK